VPGTVPNDSASTPPGLLAVALGLLALSFAVAALAFLPPVAREQAVAPAHGVAVTFGVHGVITAGLAGGAMGIVLRAGSGWWAALICAGANALYQGKLLAFYVAAIRWSHPGAGTLGWEIALRYGAPAAASLALAVALLLPRMRACFDLTSTPYVRRRRRVG
jgi:hypothetical protein